ncbi:MAG: hypothetical protein WAN36_15825 [Calditrichia bacterium]
MNSYLKRSKSSEVFREAVSANILTHNSYFNIPTGIEHRFGSNFEQIKDLLYRSMGPTTDLLRYFPDDLYLDRFRRWPTWEPQQKAPVLLSKAASRKDTGLFSFFVEYKYSENERKAPIGEVPTRYIGIIEREAWLTYRRLTAPNPVQHIYLDGRRSRIALFYAAAYSPEKLYGIWEQDIQPIAVRSETARPNERSFTESGGSGTPWINFDLREVLTLENFLEKELFWEKSQAAQAVSRCKERMKQAGLL